MLLLDLDRLGHEFDVSTRFVECDFCGVDYTGRNVSGGALFGGSKVACPTCAPKLIAGGRYLYHARCPRGLSFAAWVLNLRTWADWEADEEPDEPGPPRTALSAWAEWNEASHPKLPTSVVQKAAERRKRAAMLAVLDEHDWNIARTARGLGLTRRTIYLRLARWSISRSSVPD